jgi:hypothetical protein
MRKEWENIADGTWVLDHGSTNNFICGATQDRKWSFVYFWAVHTHTMKQVCWGMDGKDKRWENEGFSARPPYPILCFAFFFLSLVEVCDGWKCGKVQLFSLALLHDISLLR